MGNDSYPVKLTGSATTTLGAVFIYGISVNKTLTGTLTVNDGASNKAIFAIGTTPDTYHLLPSGSRYASFAAALSAGDDVTVHMRVIS